MRSLRSVLVMAASVVAAGSVYSPPVAAQSVQQMVSELEAKYRAIETIVMTRRHVATQPKVDKESTTRMWVSNRGGQQRYRIESVTKATVTVKGEARVTETVVTEVCDGRTLWAEQETPAGLRVVKSKSRIKDFYAGVRVVCGAGEPELLEAATVAGQKCVVIRNEIVRGRGLEETITYYVSEANGMIMKTVRELKWGLKQVEEITSLEVNVEVDDSLFSYRPPEGAKVVDLDLLKKRARSQPS